MSTLDIVNGALAILGEKPTISSLDPPEGSAHADTAAREYPLARDLALSEHAWNFATTTKKLATVATNSQEGRWRFAYAIPADCLTVHGFGNAHKNFTAEYVILTNTSGEKVLYTNAVEGEILYTYRETITTRYSDIFTQALIYLMASKLAGPLIKGLEGIKVSLQYTDLYRIAIGQAKEQDSMQQYQADLFVPPWER